MVPNTGLAPERLGVRSWPLESMVFAYQQKLLCLPTTAGKIIDPRTLQISVAIRGSSMIQKASSKGGSSMTRHLCLALPVLLGSLMTAPTIAQDLSAGPSYPPITTDAAGAPTTQQPSDPASPRDLFFRGMAYEAGDGVPQDFAEAARLYKEAITQGYQRAYGLLGRLYWEGWGVEQDSEEAFRLYRLGLAVGDQWAQYFMGRLYLDGDRLDADRSEAFRLFQLSAQQDNARALTLLALMYLDGDVTEGDPHEAKRLLERAAPTFGLARRLLARLKLPS